MSRLPRFLVDRPLRTKVSALLLATSVVPLAAMSAFQYSSEREQLVRSATVLLSARGDEVAAKLDGFHRAYQLSVSRLALIPEVQRYAVASPGERTRSGPAIRAILSAWPEGDPDVRGVGILDRSGTVAIATEPPLVGRSLAFHAYVKDALRGAALVSDVHFAGPEVASTPTIAYVRPIKDGDGRVSAVLALWVRVPTFWALVKASNSLAGAGSFAVLFDRFGVRVAHSYNEDIVLRPGGQLDPATINAFVAEKRFGERTRQLLEDVRIFPDQFDRARSLSPPDRSVFRGFAPVNQKWNYGVPRRLETVPWTLFYMIPEDSLLAPVADLLTRTVLVSLVITLLALTAGALLARGIVRPIRNLSEAAEALSKGDLKHRATIGRSKELGLLGTSFNAMADRLEAMITSGKESNERLEATVSRYATFAERVGGGDLTARLDAQTTDAVGSLGGALDDMVARLRELALLVQEGATVLTTAATDISVATTEVASSSSETATAVSEITATLEEARQTAQVSSHKAKHVSEIAQQSVQVTAAGRKAVGDTIDGMHRIREQMESIAESIVRLSEQSQAIGAITTTVSDLAEQSNLLAVNAAIEAAKAGEHGRGFAVVAQEVKSLAEQSKQATTQVRTILNDIQKATSAAVMATEQGSKAVATGVKQSTDAAESIRMLTDSIVDASQAATQIAVSSQQQLIGMDQVAQAMESIKQAAAQHVASIRQTEVAAHNLDELGQKLKHLVERFKV